MKRLAVFTLVLLLILPATAQFNLGIRAGYNSSLSVNNISSVFDGTYNLNSVQNELWNNFQAGVFARVFMKKLYFEPALMYSLEKKELNFKDVATGNVTFDSIADIKTIDIPLILGLKVLDLKLANLRVFAGPKLRFNAGSTPSISQLNVSNIGAEVKKANLGLEIGAGVDVLMFALDFRYNLISNSTFASSI